MRGSDWSPFSTCTIVSLLAVRRATRLPLLGERVLARRAELLSVQAPFFGVQLRLQYRPDSL